MEGRPTVAQRAGKWLDLFHITSKDRSELMFLLLKCILVSRFAKEDSQPAEIIPNLYLGSIGAAVAVREGTCKFPITHVLTAAASLKTPAPQAIGLTVPLLDAPSQDIQSHFATSSAWITQALAVGGKVLVHCFAGKSRSTTLVCAYLMSRGNPLATCLDHCKARRGVVMPNIGFLQQLAAYEAELVVAGIIPAQAVRPVPAWAVDGAAKRITRDEETAETEAPAAAADAPPTDASSVARSSRTSAEMATALDSPGISPSVSPPALGMGAGEGGDDEDADLTGGQAWTPPPHLTFSMPAMAPAAAATLTASSVPIIAPGRPMLIPPAMPSTAPVHGVPLRPRMMPGPGRGPAVLPPMPKPNSTNSLSALSPATAGALGAGGVTWDSSLGCRSPRATAATGGGLRTSQSHTDLPAAERGSAPLVAPAWRG